LIGHPDKRLPGHICLGFAGQENHVLQLLEALDEAGVAVSSGSACSANHAGAPSSILLAMGFDPQRAQGSLRVTLGRFSTESEVNRFLEILPRALASLEPTANRAEPALDTELKVAQASV
jgi:cysteine desulfurase